jgi:hypothetical protein
MIAAVVNQALARSVSMGLAFGLGLFVGLGLFLWLDAYASFGRVRK